MENRIWIKIDLINGESYIGSINTDFSTEEEILLFFEEQSYVGLKMDDVHIYSSGNGNIKIEPLDNENSQYKSSLIIPNIDNILTIKFLKENSEIVNKLKIKRKKLKRKKINNVLKLNIVKKEKK